jgi:hypothetical protein
MRIPAINVLPNLVSGHRKRPGQGLGSQAVTERLKSAERIPERGVGKLLNHIITTCDCAAAERDHSANLVQNGEHYCHASGGSQLSVPVARSWNWRTRSANAGAGAGSQRRRSQFETPPFGEAGRLLGRAR